MILDRNQFHLQRSSLFQDVEVQTETERQFIKSLPKFKFSSAKFGKSWQIEWRLIDFIPNLAPEYLLSHPKEAFCPEQVGSQRFYV